MLTGAVSGSMASVPLNPAAGEKERIGAWGGKNAHAGSGRYASNAQAVIVPRRREAVVLRREDEGRIQYYIGKPPTVMQSPYHADEIAQVHNIWKPLLAPPSQGGDVIFCLFFIRFWIPDQGGDDGW